MFDRFTDIARKVMALARREAQALNHDYIGTEHILLGLSEKPGVAARVFEKLGVNADLIRAEVQRDVTAGTVQAPGMGQLPFTPGAKHLLERSRDQADAMGDRHIGTEHLLLAMLEGEEDLAGRTLRKLELKLDVVRNEVLGLNEGTRPTLRFVSVELGDFGLIDKRGMARARITMTEDDRLSIGLLDEDKSLRFTVVFSPDGSLEVKDEGGKTLFKAP